MKDHTLPINPADIPTSHKAQDTPAWTLQAGGLTIEGPPEEVLHALTEINQRTHGQVSTLTPPEKP